jgi:hypothetical protein
MAKHEVDFTIPKRPLGRADVEFNVKRDGKPFGRLKVSNGSVVWVQGSAKYGYKISWADFDALMAARARMRRRRRSNRAVREDQMRRLFLTASDHIIDLRYIAAIEVVGDSTNQSAVCYHLSTGVTIVSPHTSREDAVREKWQAYDGMRRQDSPMHARGEAKSACSGQSVVAAASSVA